MLFTSDHEPGYRNLLPGDQAKLQSTAPVRRLYAANFLIGETTLVNVGSMVREAAWTACRLAQSVGLIARQFALSVLVTFAAVLPISTALGRTTLDVLYAVPGNYKRLQGELAARFQVERPDIEIRLLNPVETYDDGAAQVLRDSLIGRAPDVWFSGLNQVRIMVDRGEAVSLDRIEGSPAAWSSLGYIPSMLSLGEVNNHLYGLPFAISTPVVYVNLDLLRKAGGSIETFPRDWDGILELSKRMEDRSSGVSGFAYAYDASGNWLLQALITSAGGALGRRDGCEITIENEPGRWALRMLQHFHEQGMADLGMTQGRQAFAAGSLGIFVESTSSVALLENGSRGRFTLATAPFPIAAPDGRLPAGGSLAMVLAKSPDKQRAALDYVKFVTGPVGQAMMAKATGYVPGNRLALEDPKLLGGYYEQRPSLMTGVRQLPLMTGWQNWSGPNSVKIVSVIQEHINSVARGQKLADDALPQLARDVRALLPACGSPR